MTSVDTTICTTISSEEAPQPSFPRLCTTEAQDEFSDGERREALQDLDQEVEKVESLKAEKAQKTLGTICW